MRRREDVLRKWASTSVRYHIFAAKSLPRVLHVWASSGSHIVHRDTATGPTSYCSHVATAARASSRDIQLFQLFGFGAHIAVAKRAHRFIARAAYLSKSLVDAVAATHQA